MAELAGSTDAGSTDDEVTHAVVQQVVLLAGMISALATDLLTELDLTEPLANVLWRLDPDAPPPSMGTLAAALSCDPSTVTFLTDRLEQRGLIQRRPVPSNRRQKVVSLTAQGVQARARIVQALTVGSPFAKLSPADRRHLRALLARAGADPSTFTCQPPAPTEPVTDLTAATTPAAPGS